MYKTLNRIIPAIIQNRFLYDVMTGHLVKIYLGLQMLNQSSEASIIFKLTLITLLMAIGAQV